VLLCRCFQPPNKKVSKAAEAVKNARPSKRPGQCANTTDDNDKTGASSPPLLVFLFVVLISVNSQCSLVQKPASFRITLLSLFFTHRFVLAVLADMNKIYFMTRVLDVRRSPFKNKAPGMCFCLLHLLGRHTVLIWCHVSIVYYYFFYQLFAVSLRSREVHAALTFS